MPNLNSLQFDTAGLTLRQEEEAQRAWLTATGDAVSTHFFPLAPDIQAALDDIDELRRFYRRTVTTSGLGMIEVDTLRIDGCTAIRTVFKVPQQPTGRTYLGALTLPFRDFSFVAKAQCPEYGMTGLRDTVVLNEMLASGRIKPDESNKDGAIPGWMRDPYDLAVVGPMLRNLAEDEEYDTRFPDHPLSRCRALLHRLQDSLKLVPDAASAPPFLFPAKPSPGDPAPPSGRPWWKVW
jgi:hypothetical protein